METIDILVDPAFERGKIKVMNAVNNGPAVPPVGGDQTRGNFAEYKAGRFPYARLHDSINCVSGGAHAVDITAVFPNFGADENDTASYDFTFTDLYVKTIIDAGTKVFYRLGQTIEHGPKKYGVLPPADFAKWARVCEHVIRHYNEGWADGFRYGIEYWEIWNEPDLDAHDLRWEINPRTWGGTKEAFADLYETTAKHLKKCFPALKIGGPALACRDEWAEWFLAEMKRRDVPIDFFSWHVYSTIPGKIAEKASKMRELIDRNGYPGVESILNEWNYVKGWTDNWVYSLRSESGDQNLKGGAFIASVLSDCQDRPVDKLMYYDARVSCTMNGLFDVVTLWPQKSYYAIYAWAKLLDLGTQVGCEVRDAAEAERGFATVHATAARGADGGIGLYLAKFNEDNNDTAPAKVRISIKGASLAGAVCHLTDLCRTYTEVPLEIGEDGTATVVMQPLSFAFIELKK